MGGGGKHCTFAVCMPTDSSSVPVIEESYASLKEDVLGFKQKGRVSYNANYRHLMEREK